MNQATSGPGEGNGQAMTGSLGATVLALGGMVPIFSGDGNGTSVNDFILVLEQVAQMGGWNDTQKIGIAKCKMSGRAYEFAWHEERMKSVASFTDFKQLFLGRFDSESRSARLEKFMGARQQADEDVRAFATRVQRLGQRTLVLYEGERAKQKEDAARELLEDQMLTQYVHGLRDPVRRFVLSRDPKSFEEAVSVAHKEERNDQQVTSNQAVRTVAANDSELKEVRSRLERIEAMLQEGTAARETRDQSSSNYTQRCYSFRCFNCGQLGHIARNCQALIFRSDGNTGKGRGQRKDGQVPGRRQEN